MINPGEIEVLSTQVRGAAPEELEAGNFRRKKNPVFSKTLGGSIPKFSKKN